MKKLLAILVSIAMMLSSVAAFAAASPEALNVAAPHVPVGAKVVSTGESSKHYELTYRDEATGDEYKVVLHKNPLSVKKVDIDYKDKKGSKTVVLTEAQVAAQVLGAYPGAAINGIFGEKDDGLFEYVAIFERDGYLYQMKYNAEDGVSIDGKIKASAPA